MKDRPAGTLDVIGIDACKGFVPENTVLTFRETDGIRGGLEVTDGVTVYGYLTGNCSLFVKALVSAGEEVYCIKESEKTVDASKVCTVKAYRKYKKI